MQRGICAKFKNVKRAYSQMIQAPLDIEPSIMSGLRDKVVIITGASSGIGARTAVEFAKVGASVVLTARRVDKLEETAQKCEEAGLSRQHILIVAADIMLDEDLKTLIDSTVNKFGRIDVLVNNAGVAVSETMLTSSVESLDRMYRMHTRAVYVTIKLALPHLLKTRGNIVNVSSIAALGALPYAMPYAVAKAAQDHLMKNLSVELGPMGVRVNSVCPGTIKTEIFQRSGISDEVLDELSMTHPAKRLGEPEEVAKVIVFLASDDASFVSGVALSVDSGRRNTIWIPKSKM